MNPTNLKKWTSIALLMLTLTLFLPVDRATAQYGLADTENDTLTKSVLIYPPIETEENEFIVSREHMYRSHLRLGDQLGRDFVITRIGENGTMEVFENDGSKNQDYFAWQKNVLAPFHGEVTAVNHPERTNKPGNMDRESAPGRIHIKNGNGVVALFVHVREITVEEGETVKPGDIIAKVGNNGISRGPHVHVGAWKDETPLQIQMDLYADKRTRYAKKAVDSE